MTIRPFAASLVDGSVDPDDPGVHLDLTRDGDGPITLDEAMAVAEALAAIVRQLTKSCP
jgi:hypothetical protein